MWPENIDKILLGIAALVTALGTGGWWRGAQAAKKAEGADPVHARHVETRDIVAKEHVETRGLIRQMHQESRLRMEELEEQAKSNGRQIRTIEDALLRIETRMQVRGEKGS